MSVNMSETNETDYSSFSYQHTTFSFRETESGTNVNSTRFVAGIGVDPLEGSGGLDINEVAELVAIRMSYNMNADDFSDISDTAQGSAEFRGVLGANLDSASDLMDDPEERNLLDTASGPDDALFTEDDSFPNAQAFGHDKDEVFTHFSTVLHSPFSSDAGGVGGGGSTTHEVETINFRDLVGRGPVLDSNDEISAVALAVKNQVAATIEGTLRTTFVWDIAETDDAGRRFSIPSDD